MCAKHSSTRGAPTSRAGTLVRPAAANLSVSRPDVVPHSHTASSMRDPGTFTTNSPDRAISSCEYRFGETAIATIGGSALTGLVQASVMMPSRPLSRDVTSTTGPWFRSLSASCVRRAVFGMS